MSIYEELQGVATSVLDEFDQGGIKLIQKQPGSGSADDPGTATEVAHQLDAVARGVTFKYVQSGFAVETDLIVIAAVLEGVVPTINDLIEINGAPYKIVQDISVPAAGLRCAWKFIVRSGG